MADKKQHPAEHAIENDKQQVETDTPETNNPDPGEEIVDTLVEEVVDDELQRMEIALTKAEEELLSHRDAMLRMQAEMENLRKRSQRDIEHAHKYALEEFATELLGVRDSLEMGLAAAGQEQADVNSIREGTELTLKMLEQVMDKFAICAIDPVGEKFDPAHHQAMTMVESTNAEPNTVLSVIQKGYLLNDRLVRPALVTVAKNA